MLACQKTQPEPKATEFFSIEINIVRLDISHSIIIAQFYFILLQIWGLMV